MKRLFYVIILLFPIVISAQNISGVINIYTPVTAINNCTVTVGSSAGFAAGDKVLIIQMKGAEIDTTDTPSFGNILNYNNAGNYEINTIQSVAGATIVLQFQLLRNYTVAHKVQLIRVPVYTNANVTGVLTCQPWNGNTGGVLVYIDNGTTTLNANIDVKEMGFQGTLAQTTGWLNCNASYKMHNTTIEALKGESITILPITATKGTGAPANGGGGGRTDNGGGGGSNFGAGGIGGDRGWTTLCNLPAQGGKPLAYNNAANKIFLGGAGGDAQRSEGPGINMGVSGGGMVIIIANAINGNGNSIISTGKTAATAIQDGGGAGGAGGTILLDVPTINGTLNINTSGGKGGDATYVSVKCSGGGGGGGGVLWVSTAALSPNIVYSSNGGALGTSASPAINAFPGQPGGSVTGLIIPISNLPCACPNPPVINTVNITNVSCNGGSNGGITVSGSGAQAPYTYAWQPGGQITASITNLPAGVYTVTVTDDDGCFDSTSFTITEPPAITSTITPTNPLCFGGSEGSAIVNASGGVGSFQYSWSNSQSGSNATGLIAGNYSVTVTDGNGCTQTNTFSITEPPLLTANTSNLSNICLGQNALLSSGGTGGTPNYSYNWDNGINTQTTNVSPTISTVYTVTITDNNNCTAVATQTVNVNPLPSVSFNADTTSGCAILCVNFTLNSPAATSATWDFGDGNTSTSLSPFNCYTTSGLYSVSVTVTDANGCTNTATQTNYINVFANPTALYSAVPQPATLLSSTIYFNNLSTNSTQWLWSFGDVANSSSTLQNPNFTYSDTGRYVVQLISISVDGCIDTIIQTVIIHPDFALYVPNTFTPNGDGVNDTFLPSGMGIETEEFEFFVFDRWGNLIFKSNSINAGWDGKANGGANIAQIDTYVWRINLKTALGTKHQYTGKVNLLK